MGKIFLYIGLYFLYVIVHYGIWKNFAVGYDHLFFKFYSFSTILFFMVITVLVIIKKLYPDFVGFGFMGLIFIKLSLVFVLMSKTNFTVLPNYQLHFIPPYLYSLVIEALFAIYLINPKKKDEKNH